MRRFELVGGSAAKFWEIGLDGSTVTVRFGRLGAAGQSQVKAFPDVASAEAHVAKLTLAKTGKGYRPVSSLALPRDEDVLVLPDAWLAAAWPRRDRRPPPLASVPPDRELDLLTRHAAPIGARLGNATTDDDVRTAGSAYLEARLSGGNPADPFGAACVLTALGMSVPHRDHDVLAPVADDWVARLGHGFAAEAALELAGLALAGTSGVGGDTVGVARIGPGWRPDHYLPHWFAVAVRLRAILASAADAEHAAAALVCADRNREARQRALACFLVPDRTDRVEEECANRSPWFVNARLLGGAAHTVDQVRNVEDAGRLAEANRTLPLLATLMVGVGPAIGPVLEGWLHWSSQGVEALKRTLDALALVPTDEAYLALLRHADRRHVMPALVEATRRFPRRAMRLLAADARSAALLRVHVLGNPELAQEALGSLPPAAAGRVRAAVDGAAAGAEAPPEALPPVLRDPPWARERPAAKPIVVPGLVAAPEAAMAWREGEREAFLARLAQVPDPSEPGRTWAELVADEFDGPGTGWRELPIVAHAPDDVIRPRLASWVPRGAWQLDAAAPVIVARFGLDALPGLLHLARAGSWDLLPALMPCASGEVAAIVADWHARVKTVRPFAARWLVRHAGVAARALVPAAVGKPGVARRRAEEALRVVAASGHGDEVTAAAAAHGHDALAAARAITEADPLDVPPARVPVLPDWLDPALLPPVGLKDGKGALPAAAVRHLCTVFALSTIAEPYAGVAQVMEACEPLAGFWWEAFTAWQRMGYPPAENWVLQALGPAGDDGTVRRLSPLIRAWPGDGGHTRAVAGLDVLAAIGTDVALMHLDGIAQKVRFKGLRERAQEKIVEVARALGLSAEQLADRLVPSFGLDADGSLVLDFGPRAFTVGFDEQLKPYVVDGSGARRAALPKPGAKDDPVLAPAAAKRFADLKKDVRTVAADQLRRLERMMVARRDVTAAEFRALFVAHPLLIHPVRRLVWTVAGGGSFRVAEDRTFAGVRDDPFDLPHDATVGVAHPLDLPAGWAEVFADYEILQPFPQLARDTYALTADEAAATHLARWAGRDVPTGKLLGLERRGWRRGAPQDAGVQNWMELAVPGDLTVLVDLDPGIVVGDPTTFPDQRITDVWLKRPGDPPWGSPRGGAPFGALDRVTASEVLRDLTEALS